LVVALLPRLAERGRDGRDLVRVIDLGDLRRDDLRALEVASVRGDRVTRLDRARRDLRTEGLVRHGRKRVDPGALCFTLAQVLLELPRGVETGVSTTDNEDFRHGESSP